MRRKRGSWLSLSSCLGRMHNDPRDLFPTPIPLLKRNKKKRLTPQHYHAIEKLISRIPVNVVLRAIKGQIYRKLCETYDFCRENVARFSNRIRFRHSAACAVPRRDVLHKKFCLQQSTKLVTIKTKRTYLFFGSVHLLAN